MERNPIRLMIFDERPDCLVVYVPQGTGIVQLPPLAYPFTKERIGEAMREADMEFRLTVGTPGQWMASSSILKKAAKAERGQRDALATAAQNAARRESGSPAASSRAEAIERWQRCNQLLQDLKVKFLKKRRDALERGTRVPIPEYRAMEVRIAELKNESQALQVEIGKLRQKEHEEREEEWQRQAPARHAYAEAFLAAASDVLPESMMQRLHGLVVDANPDKDGDGNPPPEWKPDAV